MNLFKVSPIWTGEVRILRTFYNEHRKMLQEAFNKLYKLV